MNSRPQEKKLKNKHDSPHRQAAPVGMISYDTRRFLLRIHQPRSTNGSGYARITFCHRQNIQLCQLQESPANQFSFLLAGPRRTASFKAFFPGYYMSARHLPVQPLRESQWRHRTPIISSFMREHLVANKRHLHVLSDILTQKLETNSGLAPDRKRSTTTMN